MELAPGASHVVRVVLAKARVVARLSIVVRPASAFVDVDGTLRGAAPIDVELAPGPHEIEVRAPSFETKRIRLTLSRSESRRIDVELAPEPRPVTARWWFWTGLGVVVAGAAVGVAAATIERSPSEGSLGTFSVP